MVLSPALIQENVLSIVKVHESFTSLLLFLPAVTVSTLPWCLQLSHLAKDVTSGRRPILERGRGIVGKQEWCNDSGVS